MSLTPYDSRNMQPDDCVEADDRFEPSKSGTKGSLLNVSRTIILNTSQMYGNTYTKYIISVFHKNTKMHVLF